jgi:hypothetical protein
MHILKKRTIAWISMSFEAGGVTYDNPEQCLRDIMRMIRVGLPLEGTVRDQNQRLSDTILGLKRHIVSNPLREVDRLRLVGLEGEFHQQRGDHAQAARILEADWNRLKPRLDGWSRKNPLEPSGDRRLLRQQIWLLMHYVFYHHYRVSAQHKEALDLLLRIEDVVREELEALDYHPAGTLALLNYFTGLCYRVNRGFHRAERRMLAAQRETRNRVIRELAKPDATEETKQYELAYKDVVCARVLYGLGWIAFQQGQLLRAELCLRTAQNCLLQTRMEYLQLLIDSLLWMVIRRKNPYGDPAYEAALDHLAEQYALAANMHQLMRQRCAFELVRGYLDLAEFAASDDTERLGYLAEAQYWIEQVANHSDARTKQRYLVHRARYLFIQGDFDAAKAELENASEAAKETGVEQRAVLVLKAVLCLKRDNFDGALEILATALANIVSLTDDESPRKQPRDPVLEAECYVLMAQAYAAKKDFAASRASLDRWRLLSQFVENYYLHHLADHIVEPQNPFELKYEFPIHEKEGDDIPTLAERLEKFERWMIKSVRERRPSFKNTQHGTAYGLHRTQFGRRFGGDEENS